MLLVPAALPTASDGTALITEFLRRGERHRDTAAGDHERRDHLAVGEAGVGDHRDRAHASGLMVLTLEGDHIAAITAFHDSSVFPYFGLPRTLR